VSDTSIKPNPTTIAIITGIVLALAYLVASWFLFDNFAMQKPPEGSNWERALVIYNGIASVGFAAIGVLLGTQVQQASVARARQEAAEAKVDATEAKVDAKKKGEVIDRVTDVVTPSDDLGGGTPADAAERLEQVRLALLRGVAR